MASYQLNCVDNGDGTWTLGSIFRGPTSSVYGGTNLNTITASTGFQQAATNAADGLGHQMRNPGEVFARALSIVVADRSMNG